MYTPALFTAILAGSALAIHPVQELVKRQTLTPDIIPTQCQDTCTSTLPIYNACLSGDQDTCLTVCDDANFDPFVACFNCIIQNVPGGTSGQFQEAQQLIGQLEQACGQDGGSASATGSAAATRTDSATATGAGASFTSATSGITIGGGSSSAAGGLASVTSSLAGAASSASEAVAGSPNTPSASQSGAGAESSAPNAGVINAPNGIAALLLGAIGALAL